MRSRQNESPARQGPRFPVSRSLHRDGQTDCKLLFRDRRSIFASDPGEDSFVFKGVPKGEIVTIVALRYKDGVPELALREVEIAELSYDLVFRALSLEELKAELRKLDR